MRKKKVLNNAIVKCRTNILTLAHFSKKELDKEFYAAKIRYTYIV